MVEAIDQGFMSLNPRLGSIRPHPHCCISASRTVINLRMDQDRRRCARIELDPRVGTEGRVVAVISVIIAVHFKAWRGLFFSQATVQLQPVELLLHLVELVLLPLRLFQ